MPKKQKSNNNDPAREKTLTAEHFGPSLTEAATTQTQAQKKKNKPMNNTIKRTKWSPFPVEIKTTTPATNPSNTQKPVRNRRRRKYKGIEGSRCRKPSSPSIVSTCSSSSGLGSLGSSALTTLNGTHDTVSTPTLPSSGCSSIGFSDDKYEDTRFNDLLSERDSEIAAEDENESGAETLNDSDLNASVSVGLFTENFVKPDLTHPTVQQFYQEQRIIYRQFYDRQFSTMACFPYSVADATFSALSSHLSQCNIQSNRHQRPNKYSNKSTQKSTQDQNRKTRPSNLNEMKPRVFYNSSARLDSNNNPKSSTDAKPLVEHKKSEEQKENLFEKIEEASCSEKIENTENVDVPSDEQSNFWSTMRNNNQSNKKEQNRKREDSSNYNDYNYRTSSNNTGYKKRYEQQPRNSYRSNHQQNEKDKKAEFDLKKLIAKLDPLSAQIYEFQKATEQTTSLLCEKLYLRDLLYCTIAPHFLGCGLYIVGSTLNGFGSGISDMDLCLMISPRELDQQTDAVVVLKIVMEHLRSLKLIDKMDIILAKIPILRATFHAPFDNVVIDLNANNMVGIRNTHLLFYYSGFDWRVRPLVCAIKEWAKRRGINSANKASLTSYSLVLMAIHYLQFGVSPPILPSLQNKYPNRFDNSLDFRLLDIFYPLKQGREDSWRNSESLRNGKSLSDLLKGFFHYYAYDFNFDSSAISVRLGTRVDRSFVIEQPRTSHHSLAQWGCICIEEPFTLSNTAHSVYDERVFTTIKDSFERAYEVLDHDGKLESLLSAETNSID